MPLRLTNFRVIPEDQQGKQSLLMPTNMQPLVRSLVQDRPAASNRFDSGTSPLGPVTGPNVAARGMVSTVEVPFRGGLATTIPLPLGVTVWLDDPAANRKFLGRRTVTLINEDPAVGLRFAFNSGAISGALLAPNGNFSFPADERLNIYAFTLNPLGGNLSLVQFA